MILEQKEQKREKGIEERGEKDFIGFLIWCLTL